MERELQAGSGRGGSCVCGCGGHLHSPHPLTCLIDAPSKKIFFVTISFQTHSDLQAASRQPGCLGKKHTKTEIDREWELTAWRSLGACKFIATLLSKTFLLGKSIKQFNGCGKLAWGGHGGGCSSYLWLSYQRVGGFIEQIRKQTCMACLKQLPNLQGSSIFFRKAQELCLKEACVSLISTARDTFKSPVCKQQDYSVMDPPQPCLGSVL